MATNTNFRAHVPEQGKFVEEAARKVDLSSTFFKSTKPKAAATEAAPTTSPWVSPQPSKQTFFSNRPSMLGTAANTLAANGSQGTFMRDKKLAFREHGPIVIGAHRPH